jgi:hypothetical protein
MNPTLCFRPIPYAYVMVIVTLVVEYVRNLIDDCGNSHCSNTITSIRVSRRMFRAPIRQFGIVSASEPPALRDLPARMDGHMLRFRGAALQIKSAILMPKLANLQLKLQPNPRTVSARCRFRWFCLRIVLSPSWKTGNMESFLHFSGNR